MNTNNSAKNLNKLIATALVGLVGACVATQSAFADTTDIPTATVKFADLDVSHPAGAALLYSRIQNAAKGVCSPFEGLSAQASARMHACIDHAVARAVASVDKPVLTQLYASKQGIVTPVRLATIQVR